MASEKATAHAAATGFLNPFLGAGEWAKPMAEAPAKMYAKLCRQSLDATARCLQIQTDYVKKLAACEDPAEAFACQSEFIRKSIAECVEEGQHFFGTLQAGFPTTLPRK